MPRTTMSTTTMASSRLRFIELRKSTASQLVLFFAILFVTAFISWRGLMVPLAQTLFRDSFKAEITTTGDNLSDWTRWKIVVDPARATPDSKYGEDGESKVYFFNPILSTLPLIAGIGAVVAVLICSVIDPKRGLIRQKIEREIIVTLHHYARIEYAEHSDSDLVELSDMIAKANLHRLHELEDHWHTSIRDLETLQRALLWRERSFIGRILYIRDALGLYMQQHFTIRYENSMMGLIYIGAAVLIIIIGLRGLQFIPKDSPSLVLFAISLEFMLLIVYAFTLMYTKAMEQSENSEAGLPELHSLFGSAAGGSSRQQAERLLRMFVDKPSNH